MMNPMTQEQAVQIARGGEGAIVEVLMCLSREICALHAHVAKLQDDLEECADKDALNPHPRNRRGN